MDEWINDEWIGGMMDIKKEWMLKRKKDVSISWKTMPQTCLVVSLSVTSGLS